MGPQDRGLYIIESEISIVMTAMKRGNLWNSNTNQDANTESLIKEFNALKKSLGTVTQFKDLDTIEYLMPFLDVIRSEDVTGHVTGLALTSVNKFLAYNMIDESKPNVTSAVENLADAVTHARFVGSDPSSDEVVLMKILDVLRILILSKVGLLLTNESICEIMQSTLRICFEPRLSELLRKTSQHCLTDMVQLLFTRLPTFTEHQRPLLKKLKMRSLGDSKSKKKTKVRPKKASSPSPRRTQSSPSVSSLASQPVAVPSAEEPQAVSAVTTATEPTSPVTPTQATASFSLAGAVLARSPSGSVADLSIVSDSELENVPADLAPSDVEQSDLPMEDKSDDLVTKEVTEEKSELVEDEGKLTVNIQVTSPEGSVKDPGGNAAAAAVEEMNIPPAEDAGVQEPSSLDSEFTNPAGVTFSVTADSQDSSGAMIPYGLPAVYELFRFLASLINPYEQQNSEHQIQIGLGLVNSALEVGVDAIGQFPSLMGLVKDELARHLIALLSSERVGMFSSALRCCFLVFNSLRASLKFQLENFLVKLIDLISSESARVSYEHKELALELLVMLYKVPGFITELYLNYDCDLYTSNLFEDITKVLSKNAFPLDELLSTNHLALEGLLVILDTVEKQCQRRISDRVPQPPIFVNDGTIKSYSCETLDTISENTSVMAKASGYMFASNLGEESTTSGPIAEKSEVAVPTHENLMAIKHKKKLITTGTEQFNINPKKGIAYLQENRLLVTPIDPREVAHFLRENPHLDKNMIGEYISNKKNIDIFKAFVKSFDFTNSRIDEALRQFLECFRLPGEAPVISMIVEIFAEHWHKSNGECLADADSPYTLSYAVIMLNTDQHNANASKTNIPMTCEQFIKNLRGTNGGGDHDPEMLTEIYQAIKGDEIVMPAEQKGLVKENYLWKMLLKRGSEHSGDFLRTDNGMFDHNLFGLTWGPSIASLSYVFDRSNDPEVLKRSLDGFSKTAMIAAHYAMSDVLDNLIISLTKFTTLLSTTESPEIFKIMYGANAKALLATRAVFSLTHKFGDILREGWKNLLECLLQLFKCQLLPKSLMEAEDYIESSGRINLFREKLPREKEDSGLINSLVSFIVASSEAPHSLTAEEEEHVDMAKKTILECHPEHLLSESKFLLTESLQELVKYLVGGSVLDGGDERADEHVTLFYLELVTRITVANRDRVGIIWRSVSDHLARLISASAGNVETNFQLERAVTALLRLSVRLARKEDLASTTVQSLRILLAMKTGSIFHVSRQVSYGLHELLRNNAANIHSREDWEVIFSLLEVVGAGASPDTGPTKLGTDEDSGQGGESEPDLQSPMRGRADSGGWVDLCPPKEGIKEAAARAGGIKDIRRYSIVHPRKIVMHDSVSFLKCCESLSFLIRDVAHITPENFHTCVAAIRTFVEASYRGDGEAVCKNKSHPTARPGATRTATKKTPKGRAPPIRRVRSEPRNIDYDADESDDDELHGEYSHVTMQLLDLMHTLHTRAAGVHQAWAAQTCLWDTAWCPVLQGMARLCCDKRSEIRTQALTLLQRSLLVPDLQQVLAPSQWEFCFLRVLFPMLRKMLQPLECGQSGASQGEETRLRAAMMLSKVFLQHLGPLSSLPTFTALWLTIIDFLAQFVQTATTDILADAVPESLKNMLLVMDTSGRDLFFTRDTGACTPLWTLTWEKVDTFLPGLKEEVFGDREKKMLEQSQAKATEVVEADQTAKAVENVDQVVVPPPGANSDEVNSAVVNGDQVENGDQINPANINDDQTKTIVTKGDSEAIAGDAGGDVVLPVENGAGISSEEVAKDGHQDQNDVQSAPALPTSSQTESTMEATPSVPPSNVHSEDAAVTKELSKAESQPNETDNQTKAASTCLQVSKEHSSHKEVSPNEVNEGAVERIASDFSSITLTPLSPYPDIPVTDGASVDNNITANAASSEPSNVDPSRQRQPSLPLSLHQVPSSTSLLFPPPSVNSPGPLSPTEPPIMPCTAFSLPTSPSHQPARPPVVQQPTTQSVINTGPSVFAPITPAPAHTPSVPMAMPRPLAANPSNPLMPPLAASPPSLNPLMPPQRSYFTPAGPGLVNTAFTPTTPFLGGGMESLPFLPVFSTQKKDDEK